MQLLSLPEPVPHEVQIWLLPLDLLAPLAREDWLVLNEQEQSRARRFYHQADRVRSVVTRATLRRLLAHQLQCNPASLQFSTNAFDKPFLVDNSQLAFNVAHSGQYAMIVIALDPRVKSVGVDIERHSADLEFSELANYAFTACEQTILAKHRTTHNVDVREDRNDNSVYIHAFFRQWSGKEAMLKAAGVGIGEHLQKVSVLPEKDGRLTVEGGERDWAPLQGHTLDAPHDYSAAIAWQSGGRA